MRRSHAAQRALERHGLKLSNDDLRAIALTCAEGKGLLQAFSSGHERHKVVVYGKEVTVIYKPNFGRSNLATPHLGAGTVITIEPKEQDMALAYELKPHDPPRDMRTAAVLTCVNCGTKGKVGVAGMGNNPEKINQIFTRIGWDADVWHIAKNLCPKCVKQRAERVQADLGVKQIDKQAERLNDVPAPAVIPPVARALPAMPTVPAVSPFTLGSGTRTQGEVTEMKKLSPQQKGLLRTALESYFNPDTGRYETDWSDQRISDELQIARRVVAEFRDTFYGEVQEDPELAALRQMVEDAKRVMGNLQATLQKIDDRADGLFKKYGGK